MTDSEFSSPRKGRFSSTREEQLEEGGAAEELLDINDASLDMMGTTAKTPAASTGSKIVEIDSTKEQENRQPKSYQRQTE